MKRDSMEAVFYRAAKVVEMDRDLRQNCNDEDLFIDHWLAECVPDAAVESLDYDMILSMVENSDDYDGIAATYTCICRFDHRKPAVDPNFIYED